MCLQNHCLLKPVQINAFIKSKDSRIIQTCAQSALFSISSSSVELTRAHVCTIPNVTGFSEILIGSQHREKAKQSPSRMSE